MCSERPRAGGEDQVIHWVCIWREVGSHWEIVAELTPVSETPTDVLVEAVGKSWMHSAAQGRNHSWEYTTISVQRYLMTGIRQGQPERC